MVFLDERPESNRDIFIKRKIRQWWIVGVMGTPLVLFSVGFKLFPHRMKALSKTLPIEIGGVDGYTIVPVFITVLAVLTLIVTLANWRCPQCDGFFGRNIFIHGCNRCGFDSRDDDNRLG